MPLTHAPVYTTTIDSDRREFDCAKRILRLEPNAAPFTVLLARLQKDTVKSNRVDWYDELAWGYYTRINNQAGYDDAVLTFAVDDETVFAALDILYVPRTGETMRMASIDTGAHTVTAVARSWGAIAAGALLDNDYIVNMGNAMPENSTAPTEKLMQPSKGYNYVQPFRTPFSGSWSQNAEQLKTDTKERIRLRQSKSIVHLRQIERALKFGERVDGTDANGVPVRTMGGLNEFLTTNRINQGGVGMTESAWEAIMEQLFTHGNRTKLGLLCPSLITQLNAFPAGKIQTKSGEETYGIDMKEYISPHGRLMIVHDDMLTGPFADRSFIADIKNIDYGPLQGLDTKLSQNIQENDRHGWKDEYYTYLTARFRLEATHGVIYNIA